MHKTIDFPNLGIHLKNVGNHISIGGFDIAFYGIIIGLGILAGILIAAAEAKRTKQNSETLCSRICDYWCARILCGIFLEYVQK